ncbi:MAG: tetratricopeptide repeat protein, partial [Bacteroidota bacterium]
MKSFYVVTCSVILCCIITLQSGYAQDSTSSLIELTEDYLANDHIQKADSLVNSKLEHFKSSNQIDSLYQFPELIGKVVYYKGNASGAAEMAEAFVNQLKQKTSNPRTLSKAYLSLDTLYLFLGDDTNCVRVSKKALEYAKMLDDVTYDELGDINYIIGGNYYALYELDNAVDYFKASAKAYEKSDTVEKHILADSYNGVAVSMWTLNKLDSAQVYFDKAIASTQQSNLASYDRTYYIYAFKFNQALVIDAQGRISEAIEMKKEIIQKLQEIIDGSEDEALVKKSRRLQASSISNLAAFYNDTGYLTRAYEMLKYSYQKKRDVYEPDSPRLATTLMQIATCEFELQEFDKSIATTNTALKNLRASKNTYLSVEGEILYTQANTYLAKGEIDKASQLFEESEALFNRAYPEEYSREYLILLRDYAVFLAENGNTDKAIEIAEKTYNYILKNGGDNNLPLLKEIINLSEVHFICGNYEKSNQWAKQGIAFMKERLQDAESEMNSAQIEFYKPKLLLLDCKSKYKSEASKNADFLRSILTELDEATA